MPLSDPSRIYTRDLQLASQRPPFVVRGPALPAPAWPTDNMVGELASLDVLGPILHESGGSTFIAVFQDARTGCTWLTPMASLVCLEFVLAVQRYQQHVLAHSCVFPNVVGSLRELDVSCPLPQGMPDAVSSCATGGLGQPLVLRTRVREDWSCGNVLNSVEHAARVLLYKATNYLVLGDLSLQLLHPMLLAANFAHNVLPIMTPRPGPSPHQLWYQDMPVLDNVLTCPGALVSFPLADRSISTPGHLRAAGRCSVSSL